MCLHDQCKACHINMMGGFREILAVLTSYLSCYFGVIVGSWVNPAPDTVYPP